MYRFFLYYKELRGIKGNKIIRPLKLSRNDIINYINIIMIYYYLIQKGFLYEMVGLYILAKVFVEQSTFI